jgi:lipoyl(octanoyl) transferase
MVTQLRASGPHEPVVALHAGVFPYAIAWGWQRDLVRRRAAGEVPDVLLTLEHPPVFTAGKRADPEHVLWDEQERTARGIDFHRVDRGGDVTYHGPGQLVGYPILELHTLRGVIDYVRALEEVCVRTAADFDVEARPVEGLTGVWVGDRKLVAIGVRVSSRGVTSHGFAFNVTTDLDHFGGIVPCGIPDRGVCSLASLGVEADVPRVLGRLRTHFEEVFDGTLRDPDPVSGILEPPVEPVLSPAAGRSAT